MVFYAKDETRTQKCFFCHGALPDFVNEAQIPQKRKPFSSLLALQWSSRIDLILSEELQQPIENVLRAMEPELRYAKVIMSLAEILQGQFFNEYIKKGNISMLSEGRPGVDNVFSLDEGVLRIELDKATYERAGLVGHAIRDGGLKHKKNRFAIELNLRQPSMVRGKNGFERVLWACRNVLSQSMTWLFFDKAGGLTDDATPIAQHHPLWITPKPLATALPSTSTPPFVHPASITARDDGTYMTEVDEWFALAAIHSPRLSTKDTLDRYLSRYEVPFPEIAVGEDDESSHATPVARNLVHISLKGFFPASQVMLLFVRLRKCLASAAGSIFATSVMDGPTHTALEASMPFLSFRTRTFRNDMLHILTVPKVTTLRLQSEFSHGEATQEGEESMQVEDTATETQSASKRRKVNASHAPLEFLEWWVPVLP